MPYQKNIFLLILSLIVLAAASSFLMKASYHSYLPEDKAYIVINGTSIIASLADTPAKRMQGLSGKTGLKDNEGLLFIFPAAVIPKFWMKDMLFPIDIIWIGEDKQVVSVTEHLLPSSYPETFSPESPIKYVLEVPDGFSQKNNAKNGDEVVIKE